MDDSEICAWLVKSKVRVASVSKLKGRRINVNGSSFTVSMKTNRPATKIDFFNKGKFNFNKDFIAELPSDRDTLLSCSQFFSIPESIGCQATARKRIR